MSTIPEFLMARIAEDDEQARLAIAERAQATPDVVGSDMSLQSWPDVAVPAVLVGPGRILAECAAKRAIIAKQDDALDTYAGSRVMDHVLSALAAVYKDHPEYRQEWAV